MKNILAIIVFVFSSMISSAQDFQGMAVYESKTSSAEFKSRMDENRDITPEMKKMIEERMKKMFEKTFILNFDKTASIYKEEEKLDAPTSQGGGMRMMGSFMGGGGTHYKNLKSQTYTVDKEMMGKEFLVQDALPKIDWKLTQETKEIGGYLCFKATAKQEASQSDFRNFRVRKKEEKTENKTDDKTTEKKSAGGNRIISMADGEIPKEIEITAWYTPDIPISNGPENYQGLPGLILEVSAGKTTVLCSKIVLNVKDKKEIKAPMTGKVVSQKEYDEIMKKKMEEMKEMYQSRSGNGGGFHMRGN